MSGFRNPSRTPLRTPIPGSAPHPELSLSGEELAAAAGISPTRLGHLARLGFVEPIAPETERFTAATAARLRRMLRLHGDLGVNLMGAAIIVDLLERLERLGDELAPQFHPG